MTDGIRIEPGRATKKPVTIQFMQFSAELFPGTSDEVRLAQSATAIISWILTEGGTARYVGVGEDHPMRYAEERIVRPGIQYADEAGETLPDAPAFLVIDTLEGAHRANPVDYIIMGVGQTLPDGSSRPDFYPVKPDIFARTYDKEVG